jgi:zinc finger protein
LYAPDPDPGLETEWYDRTFEQNEQLGLNDIKVEGYSEETMVEDGKLGINLDPA